MTRLLHVSVSPRGERSWSLKVAKTFLDAYRARHPDDEIDSLDLATTALPAFDGPVIQAKYNIMHGQPHDDAQRAAWRAVEAEIERFAAADKLLFSLPMWNFGVPYALKHYFDVIVQPGYTFSFDPEKGYSGLMTGRPVAAIYARGGEYASGAAAKLDYQKPYLETILGFLGLSDVRSIVVEPTMAGGTQVAEERFRQAAARAKELARTF